MIKTMNPLVVEAITNAVHAAIAVVGVEGLRSTSMFPSAAKQTVERKLAA